MDWDVQDFTVSALGAYGINKWAFIQTQFGADLRGVPNITFAPGRLPYVYSLTAGNTKDEDKYVELRVQSPSDKPLKALLGTNYSYISYLVEVPSYGGTGYVIATPPLISEANTYSVFGSLSYDILERLSISAEGRYQIDKQKQTSISPTPGVAPTVLANDFKSFTPRLILQYKPDARSSIYASYSRGSRPGAFNSVYYAQSAYVKAQIDAASTVQGVVPEEKLWMAELGYKAQLFDEKLRVLAAAYTGRWTDRGIPSTIPIFTNPAAEAGGAPNGSVVITAPGGRVKVQGVELELSYRATRSLTVEGTFNIADTKILKTFSSDSLAVTGNGSPVGTQLPYYPKVTGTFSAAYNRPVRGGDAFLRGDLIYTGRQYETESNLAYTAPSATVNIRAGIDFDGKRIELFGTNIFDNKTATSLARTTYATYNAAGFGTNRNSITVSLPDRVSYGVKFSVKF